MYSAWRTAARPPRIDRWPRLWPLSRDQGARPTSEVKALLFRWPNSGRKATSMAAVREPTPGTLRYSVACERRVTLPCNRAWYSWSSRAISWSSQAICRRVDRPTAGRTPLSSRFRSWTR